MREGEAKKCECQTNVNVTVRQAAQCQFLQCRTWRGTPFHNTKDFRILNADANPKNVVGLSHENLVSNLNPPLSGKKCQRSLSRLLDRGCLLTLQAALETGRGGPLAWGGLPANGGQVHRPPPGRQETNMTAVVSLVKKIRSDGLQNTSCDVRKTGAEEYLNQL